MNQYEEVTTIAEIEAHADAYRQDRQSQGLHDDAFDILDARVVNLVRAFNNQNPVVTHTSDSYAAINPILQGQMLELGHALTSFRQRLDRVESGSAMQFAGVVSACLLGWVVGHFM